MREYDAVIILFKCATRLLVRRLFLSGAMGREKLKPVHELVKKPNVFYEFKIFDIEGVQLKVKLN